MAPPQHFTQHQSTPEPRGMPNFSNLLSAQFSASDVPTNMNDEGSYSHQEDRILLRTLRSPPRGVITARHRRPYPFTYPHSPAPTTANPSSKSCRIPPAVCTLPSLVRPGTWTCAVIPAFATSAPRAIPGGACIQSSQKRLRNVQTRNPPGPDFSETEGAVTCSGKPIHGEAQMLANLADLTVLLIRTYGFYKA